MGKVKVIDYKKKFMNGFHILCQRKAEYEVWKDLMYLFAVEIQNTAQRPWKEKDKKLSVVWEKREDEYKRIARKYDEFERTKVIPQMFTAMVLEFDKNIDCDLLGEIYMMLGISSNNKGQFFTPYNISKCMAEMTIDKKAIKQAVKEKGYITMNDCACGAGSTMIAGINIAKEMFHRLNWQNHIFVQCQDLDETCAQMCYIQLSLIGCAATVSVGNTLTEPVVTDLERLWFTPMYYSEVWQTRFMFERLAKMEKK